MMNDKLRAAAKAALDWLESTKTQSMEEYLQVIDSLKAALAEPEQEPVAWMWDQANYQDTDVRGRGWHFGMGLQHPNNESMTRNVKALYTAPPRREWVSLTDEEIWEWFRDNTALTNESGIRIVRAIEAKLREKNGG